MRLEFEWSSTKALANLAKHGVSFAEASTVFQDPLSLTVIDISHSRGEDRLAILGMSTDRRLLVVTHTERDRRVRIISARLATRRERVTYEEDSG